MRVAKLLQGLLVCVAMNSNAQAPFEVSQNVYRMPYENSIVVTVSRDVFNHEPVGRYDMSGSGLGSSCGSTYAIVAAAPGIVRRVVDNHNTHGPDCENNCTDFNNYVWIEHFNGEWTKYTHISRNSARNAGIDTGDCVAAGQLIGYECEIGQASGPHLHFEVRRPSNPANVQISVAGGFMTDAEHLIPAMCGVPGNYLLRSNSYFSMNCPSCDNGSFSLFNSNYNLNDVCVKINGGAITAGPNVTFGSFGAGTLRSNTSVTLLPGVEIKAGAYFSAKIGGCGVVGSPCSN